MSPLAYALSVILTFPRGGYAHHIQARGGTEHVERLAIQINDAATLHGVSPYMLASLTFHESSFDALRVGAVGEVGITQLHPSYALGKLYVRHCAAKASDVCDMLALDLGADALRHGLKVCGDYPAALGWYRTGRCVRGPAARRVVRVARHMRWLGRRAK